MIITALKEIQKAIARAGRSAKIGPTYGTNSIIPAIRARVKISSICTQNNLIKRSPKRVIKKRLIHKIS